MTRDDQLEKLRVERDLAEIEKGKAIRLAVRQAEEIADLKSKIRRLEIRVDFLEERLEDMGIDMAGPL